MAWNDASSSARPGEIDSGGKTKEEEEERGAENLQQLFPVFHFHIFQDNEAQQKASDGASEVGNHTVPSLNVVVASVGCITKVECPEAKDWCHLQNPRQFPPKGEWWLVFAKPLRGVCIDAAFYSITLSWRLLRPLSNSWHMWRNWQRSSNTDLGVNLSCKSPFQFTSTSPNHGPTVEAKEGKGTRENLRQQTKLKMCLVSDIYLTPKM